MANPASSIHNKHERVEKNGGKKYQPSPPRLRSLSNTAPARISLQHQILPDYCPALDCPGTGKF